MRKLSQASLGVEKYNSAFRQLWSLMPDGVWTDKGAILAYYRGLTKETCRLVTLAHPQTLDDALEAAYDTVAVDEGFFSALDPLIGADGDDIMTTSAISYIWSNCTEPRGRKRNANGHRRHGRFNNSTSRSRQECIEKHLCFRCKQPNHSYRDCPAAVVNAANASADSSDADANND